jgi:hypothetical protein
MFYFHVDICIKCVSLFLYVAYSARISRFVHDIEYFPSSAGMAPIVNRGININA